MNKERIIAIVFNLSLVLLSLAVLFLLGSKLFLLCGISIFAMGIVTGLYDLIRPSTAQIPRRFVWLAVLVAAIYGNYLLFGQSPYPGRHIPLWLYHFAAVIFGWGYLLLVRGCSRNPENDPAAE